MRKHDLNYAVVGGFIAAMVLAAVVSGALFAGRVGARDSYFTVLDNVADVNFGTQVRYDGYPVGQVEEIAPLAEGARMRFRVELSVEEGWRIPIDSVARIGSTSFLAAKTIDIESGRSETATPGGGEISGGAPSDVFAAMAGAAAEFGDLSRDSVKPLFGRVADLVERTGQTIDDDLPRLLGTLNSLAQAIEGRAPELVDQVAGLITRLDTSAAALQQILSSENASAVGHLVDNAEESSRNLAVASRQLTKSMTEIDRLVANLGGLVDDNQDNIQLSLKDVRYTLGAMARNIDTLVHNLEGATRNMNEFSRLIRQNPGLLLNGTPRQEFSSQLGITGGTVQ
jgi:phospholipid/cholesterol/gamma-HCH transport system substrate-binding protein